MRCVFLEYGEWLPYYEKILEEFSFDPHMDAVSCEILSEKIGSKADLNLLAPFRSKNAFVIGNSPEMEEHLTSIGSGIKIVAGSAIVKYYKRYGPPDILVTDLDNDEGLTEDCIAGGTIVLVHAHGDNIEMIRNLTFPVNAKVIGTCQCEPVGNTINLGGFTDGDRAVFLADYLESPRIILVGFNFGDLSEIQSEHSKVKKRKLVVAEELIDVLRNKRRDRFGPDSIIML